MTPAVPLNLVAGALLLAGLLLLWAVQSRRIGRLAVRVAELEAISGGLRRDLEAVGTGSLAALERLDRIEPAIEQLGDRMGPLELGSASRGYDLAIDAVGRGAGRDELIGRFGLSPGEADLVLAIHRPRPDPA